MSRSPFTFPSAVAALAASLALAPLAASQSAAPLTHADILAWEDTDNLIVDLWGPVEADVDEHEIHLITVQAANDILPIIGDEYDFIAFWMNFQPAPWWGINWRAATYGPIQNDVTGLGSFDGTAPDGTFDFHDDYDLVGSKVQGLLFLTNINATGWSSDPAHPVDSLKTSLNINHEFMHRFGIFLPDLLDGRQLQGDPSTGAPGPCGSETHWNRRVDGQGSCISLQEWIGGAPAVLGQSYSSGQLVVNTDIPDGHFSYLDLYLMGMVSPAEVDAGMSEMRYMDDSVDCSSPYFGAISDFTMADIMAAAGTRVPDSSAAQKDFKTAWVIIHQPGDPPDAAEKDKLIGILEKQQADWSSSTLGRSTMCHKLDPIVWTDLGGGTTGVAGPPLLELSGPLTPASSVTLDLVDGAPAELALVFVSFTSTPTSFLGGTLHTFPFDELVIVGTDGLGGIHGSAFFPGAAMGQELWFQVGIQDLAVPIHGASLSNAVRGTVP